MGSSGLAIRDQIYSLQISDVLFSGQAHIYGLGVLNAFASGLGSGNWASPMAYMYTYIYIPNPKPKRVEFLQQQQQQQQQQQNQNIPFTASIWRLKHPFFESDNELISQILIFAELRLEACTLRSRVEERV